MSKTITEPEILAFLHDIESGGVVLAPLQDPQWIYAGNVDYVATNGWSITIFNDANEWDYIDRIRTDDGRECGYAEISDSMHQVRRYSPPESTTWLGYGIPGYLRFRCTHCGCDILHDDMPEEPPYLCLACRQTPIT